MGLNRPNLEHGSAVPQHVPQQAVARGARVAGAAQHRAIGQDEARKDREVVHPGAVAHVHRPACMDEAGDKCLLWLKEL